MRRWTLALGLCLAGAPLWALTPEQEAFREKGVAELFDLNFAQSRAEMRKLIATDPQNPFGYLFEAGIIWWQASSEYGLFQDTPALQGLFEADVDTAFDLSKSLFDSKDASQKADGYFVAGMALGVRGQWNLYRRHYLHAYRDGKKAIKYLKKCVKLDPEYHDAYLGLGIFDYQSARLPGVLKLGAFFMMRGDAQRGKERIRQAAEKGRLVPRQAAAFLLSLMILDEKDYAGALSLTRSLRQAFPASPYYQFVEITLLHRLQDWEGSYREALALFDRAAQDPEILQRKQLSILCGLSGARCFDDASLRTALNWLDRAVPQAEREAAAQPPAKRWLSLLYFYRGIARDILRQRDSAVQDYRKTLELPDVAQNARRARQCLENACGREQVQKMLKEMSLTDDQPPSLPMGLRPSHVGEDNDPD